MGCVDCVGGAEVVPVVNGDDDVRGGIGGRDVDGTGNRVVVVGVVGAPVVVDVVLELELELEELLLEELELELELEELELLLEELEELELELLLELLLEVGGWVLFAESVVVAIGVLGYCLPALIQLPLVPPSEDTQKE